MKRHRFLLFSLLVGLLAAMLSVLTNVIAAVLTPNAQTHLWSYLLLLVAIVVAMTCASILLTRQEKSAERVSLKPRERQAMLALVRDQVQQELDHSLQGAVLQALELREQPEAVLALTSTPLTQPRATARPETDIVHAYDAALHKLLILGEPGAGKSTLLGQLALHLLTKAQEKDSPLPMPIIFNLSSWAVKRQPLTEWMVDELHTKYRIDTRQGNAWVQDKEVLPLLDGWDEVAETHREACADAINVYLDIHGLVPTVVCSRSQEY